jgi:hypothetical protein
MIKKFWLYRIKRKKYELKENIMGSPCKASLSRGVTDKAGKVSILAHSILKVSNMLSDGIEVVLGPPSDSGNQYHPLNKGEIREVRQILKGFKPINNPALS